MLDSITRLVCPVLLVLVALTAVAHADLASVRYRKAGTSHYFLATHDNLRVGDREVSLNLYLLDGRYVATFAEHKPRNARETEIVSEGELAGAVSGMTLASLGTLRELAAIKNGKPVFELVLDRAVGSATRGAVLRLAWTGGSSAPKSVQ
jgi:hypothetical protein